MTLLFLLLHVLLMPASVWSVYWYFGAAQTITPKGEGGTYEVELRNKQTTLSRNVNPYRCAYGNCGSAIQSATTEVASNSYDLAWSQKETKTRLRLNTTLPFEILYSTSYNYHRWDSWIRDYKNSSIPWRMIVHVDLGIRSDTKQSNRPPVSTMLPIVRVTTNCPRTFNLNMFDPDGDRVRCRVATNSYIVECGHCSLPPGFYLDQDSCSLTYTFAGRHGYMPIELVIEDFPNTKVKLDYSDGSYTVKWPLSMHQSALRTTTHVQTLVNSLPQAAQTTMGPGTQGQSNKQQHYRSSIPPLSKLPLQFSVLVDSHFAPTCNEGDYFPVFVSPTPANGVHLQAFVNKPFKFTVKATAEYISHYKVTVTGPSGISSNETSTGDYIIHWNPTDNEMNDHFPVCFLAEAHDGIGRVFHSELRCVTIDVGHHEALITCNETTMMVEVEKTDLLRRYEDSLHLLSSDTSSKCSLKTLSNSTHLVAVMSLDSCGTYVEEDEDHILYKNKITSAEPKKIISRSTEVEIAFFCTFPKKTNLTVGFKHKNPYAFQEGGFGSFTFQFEFFQNQQFRQQVDASTYPIEVYLDQMMFMQIEATVSIPNVELFVESCKATPEDNPSADISYSIIENGCVKDPTVQVYHSSKSQCRFGMAAFEFIKDHNEVYITCSVLLCKTDVPNTRCSQGCMQPGSHRGRREAASQTNRHLISLGPLCLAKSLDSLNGCSSSFLNLNLVLNVILVVGCLLVV
ncbi:uncharacterized protein LOC114460889 [Gouania willdenowi]|uniref:uncharacterized protein LOC114460889 n=1 Tax=Gouania willdenowi TaxID=441366 RepID=UPI001055EBB9|nr:uncharacterized protein LOC114460889 [Gouania willdenowi]